MPTTLNEFFLNTPLYESVDFSDNETVRNEILHANYNGEFDGYNPWSKIDTTYKVIAFNSTTSEGFYGVIIRCKRTNTEFQFYIYSQPKTKEIIKVGQFPSVAEFHTHEIKQYKKLLSDEKMKEFTRAMGLAAHGVGIGSFVYLRRIFEYLIMQAYEKALAKGEITEAVFTPARMDEKIKLLSNFLPDFLVEHKVMYSILSKGIHELDEQTCLASFEPLRLGIEMILDDQLIELEREEKSKAASERILKLQSSIKKG